MNKFDFGETLKKLERAKVDLPKQIANVTRKYFLSAFASATWDGKRWATVQRTLKKGGSSRNQSSPLVQSGTLRRALNNSLIVANFSMIKFKITDIPYAEIQNDGGVIHKAARSGHVLHFNKKGKFAKPHKAKYGQKVDIGSHDITIPKRQFMGQTKELQKIQLDLITKTINKVFGI